MTSQIQYDNLKNSIMSIQNDFDKFQERKIKVSGQRVRNQLLNCKKLCDTLRKQLNIELAQVPTKHRNKLESAELVEPVEQVVKLKDEVKCGDDILDNQDIIIEVVKKTKKPRKKKSIISV